MGDTTTMSRVGWAGNGSNGMTVVLSFSARAPALVMRMNKYSVCL